MFTYKLKVDSIRSMLKHSFRLVCALLSMFVYSVAMCARRLLRPSRFELPPYPKLAYCVRHKPSIDTINDLQI